MNLSPLKRLKSLSKDISKLFSDYFQSHFDGIDIKTEVGKKRLMLKNFFGDRREKWLRNF